jgi:hypothetical protein
VRGDGGRTSPSPQPSRQATVPSYYSKQQLEQDCVGEVFYCHRAATWRGVLWLATKQAHSFMKLHERCIRFMKNVTTTMSDDQMTKIKVVHIKSYRTL